MFKFSSIALSFIILIQSFGINLNDLSQIDEFIEHAKFHNEAHGDNLFMFISKHYGELKAEHDKNHQEEKEDHEKLPFKQQTHVASMTYFFQFTNKNGFRTLEFSEFRKHHFYYQPPSSSWHSDNLFQPPRLS
ncbi:hypothetical protein FEZ18_02055 [Oceanihabitans sp. IOP_32]|nr:hypothetical protein FEZ18_02055 [Oceanihabitans sp. IOP_32]